MRNRYIVMVFGGVVVVVGLVIGLTGVVLNNEAEAEQGIEYPPPQILPEPEREPSSSNIPVLQEEEKKRASEIALSDPRVQELLSEKDYQIASVGLWGRSNQEFEGATIIIAFDKPYRVQGNWPVVIPDPEVKQFPSSRTVYTAYREYDNVRALFILVNLEVGKVFVAIPSFLPS